MAAPKRTVPAHRVVRDTLRARIASGELPVHAKLPPEPQLAADFGVSRMTANKAILALVDEGWLVRTKGVGTFVARDARARETYKVQIAVASDPSFVRNDHYFGTLYWTLRGALGASGIVPELVVLDANVARSSAGANALVAFNPPRESLGDLEALSGAGVHVVVLGARWEGSALPCVDSDNVLGAAMAVNQLLDFGHRDVLFLGAFPEVADTIDRLRGFRLAMKARGVALRPEREILVPMSLRLDHETRARLEDLLTSGRGPSAIFAAGAGLGLETLSMTQRLGLRVPEDVSLIAFDDPEYLRMAHPPLSTVAQPLEAMAERVASMVVEAIESGGGPPGEHLFDPVLIARESVSHPPVQAAI